MLGLKLNHVIKRGPWGPGFSVFHIIAANFNWAVQIINLRKIHVIDCKNLSHPSKTGIVIFCKNAYYCCNITPSPDSSTTCHHVHLFKPNCDCFTCTKRQSSMARLIVCIRIGETPVNVKRITLLCCRACNAWLNVHILSQYWGISTWRRYFTSTGTSIIEIRRLRC